jgi:hypothetical protein
MERRARVIRLWVLLGILVAVIVGVAARPLAVAWRCYVLNASGEHALAEVVEKLDGSLLLLRVASGTRAGQSCAASTSRAHHEQARPGETLGVVHRPERPGKCVLESTLENSAFVLWSISGGFAFLIAVIVAGGIAVHRSYVAVPLLTSYLEADPKDATCPECGAEMAEGYLAVLAGLHWREIGEPVGMPHALSGLPGTVGWRGRPRLHAFRCETCSIVTFKYGSRPAPTGSRTRLSGSGERV